MNRQETKRCNGTDDSLTFHGFLRRLLLTLPFAPHLLYLAVSTNTHSHCFDFLTTSLSLYYIAILTIPHFHCFFVLLCSLFLLRFIVSFFSKEE